MKSAVAAFVSGLIFAIGLAVSGMIQPARVAGFLDVAGHWDPSLAFVMGGAVLVGLVAFRSILSRGSPVLDRAFHLPTRTSVDGSLVAGSILFGVGWGLSGYCPGPAIMSVASGQAGALAFVAAMFGGMGLFDLVERLREGRAATIEDATG